MPKSVEERVEAWVNRIHLLGAWFNMVDGAAQWGTFDDLHQTALSLR